VSQADPTRSVICQVGLRVERAVGLVESLNSGSVELVEDLKTGKTRFSSKLGCWRKQLAQTPSRILLTLLAGSQFR
jgi:hypothetical protein